MSAPPSSTSRTSFLTSSRRRWAAVLLALVTVLALGVAVWRLAHHGPLPPNQSPEPDPRLAYDGPFRNVHPKVGYVGDAKCAPCHVRLTTLFHNHPMGKSLAVLAGTELGPSRTPARHNPFQAFGREFLVHARGGKLWERQALLDEGKGAARAWDTELQYAIGSGTRGHSFLTERDGFLFQVPVSYFSQKQRWGLSPGMTPALFAGRPIQPSCLFCHANRTRPRPDTVNGYERPVFEGHAIGCERCHGPGELHVEERRAGPAPGTIDTSIVSPKHLAPALRDAVCEQCHLQGAARVVRRGRDVQDFRPGMELGAFWSVFVAPPARGEEQKAVSHVEQMYASRCFEGSANPKKLGCVSCHDPHERIGPERRVAHYRARCLDCHGTRGCKGPIAQRREKDDSCIDCHMPRYASWDVPHTATTDHRVPRLASAPGRPLRGPSPDGPLALFHRGEVAPLDEEGRRDLGLALVRVVGEGRLDAKRWGGQITTLLEGAIHRAPNDVAAWEGKALALGWQGRRAEALAAYETILDKAPARELALAGAAALAQQQNDRERALGYWRRAVAVSPWTADYRRSLAQLLEQERAWDEALTHAEAWLRIDPGSAAARQLRTKCLLHVGRKESSRR